MDNKLFDHIEQQMRTAANNWEPAFDEKAWEDMERKLEGENDRRRPVAWWRWLLPLLFLLILVTGGYFLLEKTTNSQQADLPADNFASGLPEIISKEIDLNNKEESSNKTANSLSDTGISNLASSLPYKTPYQSGRISPGAFSGNGENKFPKKDITINEKGKMTMKVSAGRASEDEKDEIIKDGELSVDGQQKETLQERDTPGLNEEEKKLPVSPEKTTETTVKKEAKTENKKNNHSSKFYFSIAGGIEGNGVDFPGTNKFGTRAGFITGYQLTKKLSIQTGFFAGNKKYVAGRGDYKAKGGYWATVDITKVDADCRVYEIPLALRYDFTPSAKWNSFAVAGLSSYIMDKEDYAYDYIRFGNPYYAKATYKGNQHFLSVIRLSGGIERKITSQFSLGINPGIAIPLAGVGEGQIKLFSTELLLSLKYRPFKRSK